LIQIGELSEGVFAGPRAANAGGDLFPISHILSGIVSADDRNRQETPWQFGSRNLALRHVLIGF
jgi:hypothetical protein